MPGKASRRTRKKSSSGHQSGKAAGSPEKKAEASDGQRAKRNSGGRSGSRRRVRPSSSETAGIQKSGGHSGGPKRNRRSGAKSKRRILWIPGLGADRRMYGSLQRALDRAMPGMWQHDFIDFPDSQEALAGISSLQGLAETTLERSIRPLQKHHRDSRPYYDTVVGVSMGGMLGQILVGQNLLHTENLVLISTAYRGSDLRQPFLGLSWIPALLPEFLRTFVQWIVGSAYPLFRRNVAEAKEFSRMFLEFPGKIFFEAPRWIKKWKGEPGLQATLVMKPLPPDSQSVRAFRIHGTRDPLLSYRKIRERIHLDFVVDRGSHIVFATHADTIAEELRLFLNPARVES